MRTSATIRVEALVSDLVSRTLGFSNLGSDLQDRLLLQCVSIGLTRTISFSGHSSLFVCLGLSLTEVLLLPRLYESVFELPPSTSELKVNEIKDYLDSILFKEAGAVTGVFCNQYILAGEKNKNIVENLIWEYCRSIYYGHTKVAMHLKDNYNELLKDFDKIAESAFLMVVVFALAVTKHKLSSKFDQEIQTEVSLKILVSFSCVEHFRNVRLPEYMETRVHGDNSQVVSLQKLVEWRVVAGDTVPGDAGSAAEKGICLMITVLQLAQLPNIKVATVLLSSAFAYDIFWVFISPLIFHESVMIATGAMDVSESGREYGAKNTDDTPVTGTSQKTRGGAESRFRKRSKYLSYPYTNSEPRLKSFPAETEESKTPSPTPKAKASSRTSNPKNGSLSSTKLGGTRFQNNCLVGKANQLCSEVFTNEADAWKQWQGEPEPSKKLLELLLRLVFLVDIQVLPNLMQLLAQLITKLPQDAQNIALNELYSQVADSDDVVRKPMLVSWLQSLSYLCTKALNQSAASQKSRSEDPLNGERITADL
ncbi:hypothetical protein RYX36_011481 [Vicia faba]